MLDLAFGLTPTSRLSCQIQVDERFDGATLTLPKATRNFYVVRDISFMIFRNRFVTHFLTGWSYSEATLTKYCSLFRQVFLCISLTNIR
jgi:hypothetical protein